ncbi:MAG: hypothetical protein AB1345_13435 [Chloroflexota bacterium]
MSGWLKAGLIGVVIVIVLNLIGLIQVLVCITLPLIILTYIGVGVLAAAWMPPKRMVGSAAGQGALAALITSLGSGLVNVIINAARAALGGTFQYFSNIPPELWHSLQEAGIPPRFFLGIGGALIGGMVCCTVGLVIAAGLGAIGAAIYAAVKPE